MRADHERFLDILEAIARIERYAARGREAFEREELIQTWIVHHLQIIGEAVRAVSPVTREAHPEIPWDQITGMRHVLVHQYFGVDREIVWGVVQTDLAPLKNAVRAILQLPPDLPPTY